MEDTKEELIKSIKKTLKMQTIIKKWDDLSKEEVEKIFSLRSEVFIVEQECPYQDVDGRDAEAKKEKSFSFMEFFNYVKP